MCGKNANFCMLKQVVYTIFTHPQISSCRGEWGEQGMWYAWERRENYTRFWWESPKERDQSEDQSLDERMVSKWMLGRLAGGVCIGFDWLRIGTSGELLRMRRWTYRFLRHEVTILVWIPLCFKMTAVKIFLYWKFIDDTFEGIFTIIWSCVVLNIVRVFWKYIFLVLGIFFGTENQFLIFCWKDVSFWLVRSKVCWALKSSCSELLCCRLSCTCVN
jgi:hypothetical protein